MQGRFDARRGRLCFVFILFLAGGFFMLAGCGKKTAPVAPKLIPPPAASDLAFTLEGNQVRLTWAVSTVKRDMLSRIAGFLVYRARQDPAEADCKDCPVRFDLVARVPARKDAQGNLDSAAFVYSEPLDQGFLYTYKVTPFAERGLTGGDSNFVSFAL